MKSLTILAFGDVDVDTLKAAGHVIHRAHTLPKAVATAEETSPHVLVMRDQDAVGGEGALLSRMLTWVRGMPSVEVPGTLPPGRLLQAVHAAVAR